MVQNFTDAAGLTVSSSRRRFLTMAAVVPAVTALGVGTASAKTPAPAGPPTPASTWSG